MYLRRRTLHLPLCILGRLQLQRGSHCLTHILVAKDNKLVAKDNLETQGSLNGNQTFDFIINQL